MKTAVECCDGSKSSIVTVEHKTIKRFEFWNQSIFSNVMLLLCLVLFCQSLFAVPAPNWPLPDGVETTIEEISVSAPERISAGSEFNLNLEEGSSTNCIKAAEPLNCYASVSMDVSPTCYYIDRRTNEFKQSMCSAFFSDGIHYETQDLFEYSSVDAQGNDKDYCGDDGVGGFNVYVYGGDSTRPYLEWRNRAGPAGKCTVKYNGRKPDQLLGPTWLRAEIDITMMTGGWTSNRGWPTARATAEKYIRIDGDLAELGVIANVRFADNREKTDVDVDDEFSLVLDLTGDEATGGGTVNQLNTRLVSGDVLEVLQEPSIPSSFAVGPNQTVSFTWRVKAVNPGNFWLSANGTNETSGGKEFSFNASLSGTVALSEFDVEVSVLPEILFLNETETNTFGDKCIEYNESAEDDEKKPNCVQIDVKVTNTTDDPIDNVNMLHKDDITEAIDVLTDSTDIEDNKVPLIQFEYLTPVDDDGNELSDPITLEPDKSATFTWLVEAEAESNPLEIRPVVLGSIDNENVQGSGVGELEIKENILLKFGAKLKYPTFSPFSGAPIRLEGFLENHSTENWISATVIAYPEDNAGRGVLFDKASDYRPNVNTDTRSCRRFAEIEADGLPDFLQVFTLAPAESEDEPTRIDLEGVLATLCWDEASQASVKYVVRSYTLETSSEGELITNSEGNAIKLDEISEQTKIEDEDGYNDNFTIALRANPDIPTEDVSSDCQYVLWGFHLVCEGARGVYAFGYGLAIEFPVFLFEVGRQDLYYGARLAHWTAEQWANMYRAFFNEDANAYSKLIAEAKLVSDSFVRAAIITADQQESLVVAAVDELGELAEDFEKGDYKKLSGKGAYLAGENIDAILGSGIVKSLATKMQRGRFAANADEISGLTKSVNSALETASVNSKALEVERKVLPTKNESLLNQGDELSYRVTEALGGVPKNVMTKIEDIATKYNANLAFRSRGFGAIEKLKNGLAYFKPQPIKLKNTNQMDVDWFSYPAQALDQVLFVEPPAEILAAFREVFEDTSSYTVQIVNGSEVRKYKKNLSNDIRITRALDTWVKNHPKFETLGLTDKPNGLTALDLVLDRDEITKIDDFDRPAQFEEYLAVRERLRLHGEEWFDYQKNSKFGPIGDDGFTFADGKYVKDGLPLEFEYSVNGLPKIIDQLPYLKGTKREFRLAEGAVIDNPTGDRYTQLLTTDGRRIFTPQMNGPNGFRGFTGDIDFMHILDASGAVIENALRRFLIYYDLAKEVGMQHGESFTFALNEASRSRYLNAHDVASPVREVLYSVFPNRVKVAAYYAKHRTILADLGSGVQQVNTGEKVRQYFVPITGGNHRLRTAALRTLSDSIDLILKPASNWERFIASLDRTLEWVVPLRLLSRAAGVEDTDLDSKFRDDRESDDSQIVQERDGELVTLQPSTNRSNARRFEIPPISYEWQSVEPAEVQDASGLISSLPYSALRVDFAANATQLEVARLDELGVDEDSPFIRKDDFLVINPTLPTEETVRVINTNPLTLERGLQFDHYAGEMVAVLPLRFFSVNALDSDADGTWDIDDDFPEDPTETTDTDGDGIGNNEDEDDDNDGFSDDAEMAVNASPLDTEDTPLQHQPVQPSINQLTSSNLRPLNHLYLDATSFEDPDEQGDPAATWIEIVDRASGEMRYSRKVANTDPIQLPKSLLDTEQEYSLSISYEDATGQVSEASEPILWVTSTDPADGDGNQIQDSLDVNIDYDLNQNSVPDIDEGIQTLVEPGGRVRGIESSSGDISQITAYVPDDLPGEFSLLPNGMIGYRIDNLDAGGATTVTHWFVDTVASDFQWYSFDENKQEDDGYTSMTSVTTRSQNRLTLELVDGGTHDLDGVENGRIVVTSGGGNGSAIVVDADVPNSSGSGGGGGGCVVSSQRPLDPILPLLAVGSLWMLTKRRRINSKITQ